MVCSSSKTWLGQCSLLALLVLVALLEAVQAQGRRGALRRPRSMNGAASNDGAGLVTWQAEETFHWQRAQRVEGRRKRQAVECCSKVLVAATGAASRVQWDRMGLYTATQQTLHGRKVYQHENWTQSIFYIYGQFDGWLLGPRPDENFGGVKSPHDEMCVHSTDTTPSRGWGYYAGPSDTRDPEEAFPHWKQDDTSLSIRCVPKSVHIDSRKVPDPARAPLLIRLYRRAGPLIRRSNGSPPTRGTLNMEAWQVTARCAGDCRATAVHLSLATGQADILLVAAQAPIDLANYCFSCHPYWTGRLQAGESASWSTNVPGQTFQLYVVIVGYAEYISLNIKVDSINVLEATAQLLTDT